MSINILFDPARRPRSLAEVATVLRAALPYLVREHSWSGFGVEIPQLIVETNPPLALQVSDHESVIEESQELADDTEEEGDLSDELIGMIRRCDVRVEVTAHEPTRAVGIAGTGLVTWTPNLDTCSPEVRAVVLLLSQCWGGVAYDNVNGEWIRNEG